MYDVKSQKVLGSLEPKEGIWSIPFEYEPEDIKLVSTRGSLYIVVDFEASPNIDLHLASKIIIDEIKEKYYGDLDGTPLQALENALIAGKNKLQEIAESNKNAISNLNFNIVSCVVWGRVIYIAQVGDTACLIIRNGESVDISNKTSGEVMTSSGLLESEDVVIIGTRNFEQKYNNDSLITYLGNLENLFQSSAQAASLSAVVIRFKKSVIPGKKDISNFISSFNFNSKTDEKPEPVKEEPKIEQQQAVQSINLDQFNTETQPNKGSRGRKPKKLMMSGLVLIFALALSGSGYYFFTSNNTLLNNPDIALVDLQSYRERFDSLKKDKASVDNYRTLLNDLQKELSADVSNKDVIALLDQVEAEIENVTNTRAAANKNLFIDLSEKSKSSNINKISLLNDSLLVSDIGAKQAYLINKSNVSEVQELAVKENFLLASYSDGSYYILNTDSIFTGDSLDSLEEYSLDKSLSDAKDLVVYFGNVYILSGNSILKYTLENDTYVQSVWAEVEAGSPNSVAIDGSIYIAVNNSVEKYYLGDIENFSINNLPNSLVSPIILSTSRENPNLYVLDKNSMYTVTKSSGNFVEQTSVEDVKVVPSSFALDENELYLSSGSRVFKLSLGN